MSAIAGALSSRRFISLLPWFAGAILVAGLVTFLIVFFGNTSKVEPINKAAGPPVRSVDQRTVPLDPKISRLANQFMRIAVGGKDAVKAYEISGPGIRQGMTLAQWKRDWSNPDVGVPIIPYPIDKVSASPFRIDYSYPKEALLEVALLPKKGAGIKAQIFFIGFKKLGGANGHWVVNYWAPHNAIATPSQ